jgi:hypothetical protein
VEFGAKVKIALILQNLCSLWMKLWHYKSNKISLSKFITVVIL